ncbi:formate dehydrogenase accessory sulfurtransferase FdhD [Alteromonas sp. KUL49]|uniref:formate dehydrogenase accessory sulfurtransferase FdhD n=1 Tax=Alteromonas sp. KUL49 TaxID=2480798 RepID=UPI00102F0AE8|nr:formate dehydrogenase accessory sulfurtransferase FdhD [Alteromonas sp. KUL49]TAP40160.1 formate dehydrogenase accessory sulfurtransferase FdhD [Alteromonas sp. KUL49]GEA11278.1 sulfurtransferase FdhD [Alteromonas sp. KUL49]
MLSHTVNNNLVEEIPLVITLNDIHFSVMLVSPFDIEDFVVGYLFSELIIESPVDVHDIDVNYTSANGIDTIYVNVTLANRRIEAFKHRQRTLKGASGCGLCGKAALADAFPALTPLPDSVIPDVNYLSNIRDIIPQWQHQGQSSGALHGAFWIDNEGEVTLSREDIGRHNAMDKLLGALHKRGIKPSNGTLVITSRCGAELVQKAIISGVGRLASLASPSTLAVSMAAKYNLHLIHIPKLDSPYLLKGRTQ